MFLAQEVIASGGIIAVDDFTNIFWIGVSEGVHRFFIQNPIRKICPIAIYANKMYFTTHSHQKLYIDYLKEQTVFAEMKEVSLWGNRLLAIR
jgi:hypothetical protein